MRSHGELSKSTAHTTLRNTVVLLFWVTFLSFLFYPVHKNDKRKCWWLYFGRIYMCCQSFSFLMSLLFPSFLLLLPTQVASLWAGVDVFVSGKLGTYVKGSTH